MYNRLFWVLIINNDAVNGGRTTFWTHCSHLSLLTAFVCLFLVDSNKFLGRFFTVSITVSNQFSVLLEGLTIFVSHQKHIPLTFAMSTSLMPRRWAKIITPISSIRFSFTAHKIRAAAVPAFAVSIPGVVVINNPHTCIPCGCLEPNRWPKTSMIRHQSNSNQSALIHS